MKYKKLKVHNVRSYYGTSELHFSVDPEKSVTLIFGPHGGGKTTLIMSMWWVLFGTLSSSHTEGDGESELFNTRALDEIDPGSSGQAYVELELLVGDVVWRLKRTIQAIKDKNSNMTYVFDMSLTKIINNEPEIYQPNQFNFIVKQLLPAVLARYIIYPGEQMPVVFANNADTRKKLETAVSNLTGQVWAKEMRTQAKNASTDLRKLYNVEIGKNEASKAVHEKIKAIEVTIGEYEKEIEKNDRDISALEKLVSGSLEVLRVLEDLEEFVEAVKASKKELEDQKNNEINASEELRKQTSSLWKVQSQGLMKKFSHWFDEHGADFPLIVNENLVLHMKHTGSCICGHSVSAEEIKAVEEHLMPEQESGSRFITELFESARAWEVEASEVKSTFESLRAKKIYASEQVVVAEASVEDAATSLEQATHEHGSVPGESDIAGIGRKLERDRREMNQLIGGNKAKKIDLEHSLIERERLLMEGAAGGGDKVRVAEASYRLAKNFYDLLGDEEEVRTEYLKPKFEEFLNDSYWVHKKDRLLTVTPEWSIVAVDVTGSGEQLEVMGGGAETALLAYAFASAIARIIPAFPRGASEVTPEDMDHQTYPLMVDAPFTAITNKNYQKTIFDNLPGAVNQLILLTEPTDLSLYEELLAEGKVGECYMVKYSGPLHEDNLDDEAKSFRWRGDDFIHLENTDPTRKTAVIEKI
jgi:DNA sulfur modification protein DndD